MMRVVCDRMADLQYVPYRTVLYARTAVQLDPAVMTPEVTLATLFNLTLSL